MLQRAPSLLQMDMQGSTAKSIETMGYFSMGCMLREMTRARPGEHFSQCYLVK